MSLNDAGGLFIKDKIVVGLGAKEVVVTNTGWADFVFRPEYRLSPLSEVDEHIKAHHRLPGIPSE